MVARGPTTELTENVDPWLKRKLLLYMMVEVKG